MVLGIIVIVVAALVCGMVVTANLNRNHEACLAEARDRTVEAEVVEPEYSRTDRRMGWNKAFEVECFKRREKLEDLFDYLSEHEELCAVQTDILDTLFSNWHICLDEDFPCVWTCPTTGVELDYHTMCRFKHAFHVGPNCWVERTEEHIEEFDSQLLYNTLVDAVLYDVLPQKRTPLHHEFRTTCSMDAVPCDEPITVSLLPDFDASKTQLVKCLPAMDAVALLEAASNMDGDVHAIIEEVLDPVEEPVHVFELPDEEVVEKPVVEANLPFPGNYILPSGRKCELVTEDLDNIESDVPTEREAFEFIRHAEVLTGAMRADAHIECGTGTVCGGEKWRGVGTRNPMHLAIVYMSIEFDRRVKGLTPTTIMGVELSVVSQRKLIAQYVASGISTAKSHSNFIDELDHRSGVKYEMGKAIVEELIRRGDMEAA